MIGISDGDTLTVLQDSRQTKIRLAEIDAPELGQPHGRRAKGHLSALCHGKRAQVAPITKDIYGRTVARVSCDGVDASTDLLRHGLAWVYDKHSTDKSLYRLQDEARSAGIGLWSESSPTPPWQWRKAAKTLSR